jgi:cyclitol reductase
VISQTHIAYRAYRHSSGSVSLVHEVLAKSRLTEKHEEVVLIQPSFVGICSADVRELRGERPGKCDFGHEIVGSVLESTHPGYTIGQCVALNPFVKVARETAFAEVMYVAGSHALLELALLQVPANRIEFSAMEPLACVIHAARQSQIGESGPKLVFGAGFFGYLLYCYLEFKGIPVMLGNRTRDRLDHLRKSVEDKGAGRVSLVPEVERYTGNFSTVFLTHARVNNEDVSSAASCSDRSIRLTPRCTRPATSNSADEGPRDPRVISCRAHWMPHSRICRSLLQSSTNRLSRAK